MTGFDPDDGDRGVMAGLRSLESSLPRFSLDRRVTVLVLVATMLVLGVVAMRSIPLELIPSGFSNPFLRVAVPWPDAPPEEVLDKVILPLEEELSTVRGIDNVYSFGRTGYGQVFMSFKLGTDMDIAYREVRDRVERARLQLPDDIEQVFIRKDDEASFPVAMIGLAVDPDTADIYDLIQDEVVRPLERIEGVATVGTDGLEEKEILIELDRERVDAVGLNIFQIAQDLAKDNFSMASGNVRSGDQKLLLRSVARYRSPASVGDLQITPTVRLSDIATIVYDEPEKEYLVRVNSRPAYAMMVMKEGEANTLEVADRVSELAEQLRQDPRLSGMQIDTIMDQGEIIRDSLSVLLDSGKVGALFAMVVLLFFLRRVRLSLIIAASIPLSMVVALVAMFFAGETLNILSLLGLMISVGLLVDNAVVVAENIHRIHREEELSRREACIKGASQIAMAITTATLTTIVVFLPMALVEGQGQFFMMRLALPITVSLAASLMVALIVIPLAVYLTLPRRGESPNGRSPGVTTRAHRVFNAVLKKAYDVTFGAMNRTYGRLLELVLARRLESVVLIVGLIVFTQWYAQGRLDVVPMSEDDQAWFEVDVEMPESLTFEETSRWFLEAEKKLEVVAEEMGLDFYMFFQRRNWGEIQGALAADSPLSTREVSERILEILPEMPGAEYHTGTAQEEEEDEVKTHTVTLYGEDAEQLDALAESLEERFRRAPGVLGVKKNTERSPNELALVLDRDRAQAQGVNPQRLAGVVSYALRGQPLPRVYYGGRDIPVRVRYEEEDREGLSELGNFSVPTDSGGSVALSTLVDVEQLPAPTTIFRRNKRTARRIVLELENGREEVARKGLRDLAGSIDLPEGVSFSDSATRPQGLNDEARNIVFAIELSVIFVYLLMGFLFESFLLPLAILVTIPLANLGVVWVHLLTGRDLDFLGMIGLIILIGVVVNNGIVLLDYVQRLRADSVERLEAIRLASERRFRPIMMTALTTICGMVPLTLGEPTRMGLSYKSFGLTLIGGMVTASVLTLLVVPLFYTLFEDGRDVVARVVLGTIFGDQPAREGLDAEKPA